MEPSDSHCMTWRWPGHMLEDWGESWFAPKSPWSIDAMNILISIVVGVAAIDLPRTMNWIRQKNCWIWDLCKIPFFQRGHPWIYCRVPCKGCWVRIQWEPQIWTNPRLRASRKTLIPTEKPRVYWREYLSPNTGVVPIRGWSAVHQNAEMSWKGRLRTLLDEKTMQRKDDALKRVWMNSSCCGKAQWRETSWYRVEQ